MRKLMCWKGFWPSKVTRVGSISIILQIPR